jgi:hypothetical protein
MRDKFLGLVDFAPARSSEELFARLRAFGERRGVDLLRNAAELLR